MLYGQTLYFCLLKWFLDNQWDIFWLSSNLGFLDEVVLFCFLYMLSLLLFRKCWACCYLENVELSSRFISLKFKKWECFMIRSWNDASFDLWVARPKNFLHGHSICRISICHLIEFTHILSDGNMLEVQVFFFLFWKIRDNAKEHIVVNIENWKHFIFLYFPYSWESHSLMCQQVWLTHLSHKLRDDIIPNFFLFLHC